MLALLYIILAMSLGCSPNVFKHKPKARPLIIAYFDYSKQRNLQNVILEANSNYGFDIVFADSSNTDKHELKDIYVKRHALAVLSNLQHLDVLNINPHDIKLGLMKAKMPKNITQIQSTSDLKILCKTNGNWLLDMPDTKALEILKQMPRSCQVQKIWVTADLSKYKDHAYLQPILKNVTSTQISDKKLMQLCMHKLRFYLQKKYARI